MFNPFKKRKTELQLSVVELSPDGYCAVVGESHYQEALRATSKTSSVESDGRRTFSAVLVPEPDNPYDTNAVAIHSPEGKLGHLSRENAAAYRELFDEVLRLGNHGATCAAYLTGGDPDKPSFGVVLQLADPSTCLARLRGEDFGGEFEDDEDGKNQSGAGYVRRRHFTEYVEQVKELRRIGREEEAERLLLELVAATEAEARTEGYGVAPWYYEQLAIIYRKRNQPHNEVKILERFSRQPHAPGAAPPKLLARLDKAQSLLQQSKHE